jgi:hypothetical protein
MNRRAIAIAVIWLVVLMDAVRQGYMLPSLPHLEAWRFDSSFGVLAILLPVVFFPSMAFWIKGYPFDVPPLRIWINRRFGDRSYENFLARLRLILLFAVAGLLIGTVGLIRAYLIGATQGAYVIGVFFISAAAGFLMLRLILARRGLSFE